jgi:hypothetical protein
MTCWPSSRSLNPTAAVAAGVSGRDAWDLLAGQGYRFFRQVPTGLTRVKDFPAVPEG